REPLPALRGESAGRTRRRFRIFLHPSAARRLPRPPGGAAAARAGPGPCRVRTGRCPCRRDDCRRATALRMSPARIRRRRFRPCPASGFPGSFSPPAGAVATCAFVLPASDSSSRFLPCFGFPAYCSPSGGVLPRDLAIYGGYPSLALYGTIWFDGSVQIRDGKERLLLRAGRKLWWFYLIALAVFLADQ